MATEKRIPTKHVKDWSEFAASLDPFLNNAWLFRGVCSVDYPLVSRVGRTNIREQYSERNERAIFDKFKREARPYLTVVPRNNWEWLALAEHHGVPTRLINWSESPLVATFFAVATGNPDKKTPAAVYVVPRPKEYPETTKDPFRVTTEQLVVPAHVTQRIAAQKGVFTIHPRPTKSYQPEQMLQIRIPNGLREDFRRKLDALGINEASIYPDIRGLSDYLSWLYTTSAPAGAMPLERTTIDSLSLRRRHLDPNDPHKGQWGESETGRGSGWRLSAAVGKEDSGWYDVTLWVEVDRKIKHNKRRLTKPVTFYLHPTFEEDERIVRPRDGKATLSLEAYGAFTVGAMVSQDGTKLELDLAELPGVPKGFREN